MTDVSKKTLEILRPLVGAKTSDNPALDDKALLELQFDDLDLDSLAKMELIMEVEDAFNLSLEEEDVLACDKVSDLVQLIERSS